VQPILFHMWYALTARYLHVFIQLSKFEIFVYQPWVNCCKLTIHSSQLIDLQESQVPQTIFWVMFEVISHIHSTFTLKNTCTFFYKWVVHYILQMMWWWGTVAHVSIVSTEQALMIQIKLGPQWLLWMEQVGPYACSYMVPFYHIAAHGCSARYMQVHAEKSCISAVHSAKKYYVDKNVQHTNFPL